MEFSFSLYIAAAAYAIKRPALSLVLLESVRICPYREENPKSRACFCDCDIAVQLVSPCNLFGEFVTLLFIHSSPSIARVYLLVW
jgi:hypothetical protein